MASRTVRFAPPGVARTFSITGDETDGGVLLAIERDGGRYEDHICRFLAHHLRAGDVAIDIGANIGALTVLMASLVGPAGRVHAVEPAPQNLAHLRRNIEANALTNVTVHETAVGDSTDPIELVFDEAVPSAAHVVAGGGSDDAGAATVEVPCTTLDALVESEGLARVDLLKVDVEGAEPSVLRGGARAFAALRPTTIMECNPAPLRQVADMTPADLLERLGAVHDHVSLLSAEGIAVPVRSRRHLELALGRKGLVDLVARPRPAGTVDRLRSLAHQAELAARMSSRRLLVDRNYVVTPDVELRPPARIEGPPGGAVSLDVTVRNRSRWWLSSGFPYVPVMVGCRWRRADGSLLFGDGPRGAFTAPLAPGGEAVVPVTVHLPPEQGRFLLDVTLVQETYAWLDQIDPRCAARVEVDVAAGG